MKNGATLTELDLQVLATMEQDPTISNQALADSLGITRAQVLARLTRIESLDIAHVVALTDVFAGDARMVNLYVKASGRPVADLASTLTALPFTMSVVGLLGPDDLLVAMRLPAGRDTADALDLLMDIEGVGSVRSALVLQAYLGRSERMHFSQMRTGSVEDRKARLMVDLVNADADDLDLSLIAEFQTNGRARIRDLSHRYGLTQGAIRYRLKNLHSKKLLRLALAVDPLALGLQFWTSFEISVAPKLLPAVVEQVCEHPHAVLVTRTTGTAALQCVVLTPGIQEARGILDWLRQLEGVTGVTPQVLSDVYKNEAIWGIFPH